MRLAPLLFLSIPCFGSTIASYLTEKAVTINVTTAETLQMNLWMNSYNTWAKVYGLGAPDDVMLELVGETGSDGDRFAVSLTNGTVSYQGVAAFVPSTISTFDRPISSLQYDFSYIPASFWTGPAQVQITPIDAAYSFGLLGKYFDFGDGIQISGNTADGSMTFEDGSGFLGNWVLTDAGDPPVFDPAAASQGGDPVTPTPEPSLFGITLFGLIFLGSRHFKGLRLPASGWSV